jgi:hypothetical protein
VISFVGVISKVKGWMLGVLGIVAVVVGLIRMGRKAEEAEQQVNSMKESINNVKVSREVEQSIHQLPDADIDQRMRERGDFRD